MKDLEDKLKKVKSCQITKKYKIFYNRVDFCILDKEIPCTFRYLRTNYETGKEEYGCNNI